MKNKILILGIGNDILSDDGIGIKLVKDIRRNIRYSGTDYQTASTGGIDIVEVIRDYRNVIIIDAIKTKGGIPASVYHFTPANFNETMHISSFHDISFLEAIEMGKTLDFEIPENIHIVGIEILEDRIFSEKFSKIIQKKYNQIFMNVVLLLNDIMEEIYINSRKTVNH